MTTLQSRLQWLNPWFLHARLMERPWTEIFPRALIAYFMLNSAFVAWLFPTTPQTAFYSGLGSMPLSLLYAHTFPATQILCGVILLIQPLRGVGLRLCTAWQSALLLLFCALFVTEIVGLGDPAGRFHPTSRVWGELVIHGLLLGLLLFIRSATLTNYKFPAWMPITTQLRAAVLLLLIAIVGYSLPNVAYNKMYNRIMASQAAYDRLDDIAHHPPAPRATTYAKLAELSRQLPGRVVWFNASTDHPAVLDHAWVVSEATTNDQLKRMASAYHPGTQYNANLMAVYKGPAVAKRLAALGFVVWTFSDLPNLSYDEYVAKCTAANIPVEPPKVAGYSSPAAGQPSPAQPH